MNLLYCYNKQAILLLITTPHIWAALGKIHHLGVFNPGLSETHRYL